MLILTDCNMKVICIYMLHDTLDTVASVSASQKIFGLGGSASSFSDLINKPAVYVKWLSLN